MRMQLRRHWSICISTRRLWRKWAPPPDVALSRILPGTIFERDCWTHTKPRCAWCDNFFKGGAISRSPAAVWKPLLLIRRMKILLLQLKRIGDLILTTPAIAALRKNYPGAHITLAVSNECAELLPAISNVDRVLIARRNLRDVAMVSSVAGKRFDYCIDFTRNDRSALLTLLSGARKRVASYRVREQSKTRARVYTDFVGVRVRDLHTIDYNLALLEPLGVRAVSSAPQLEIPRVAHEKADSLRRDWKIARPYVILHPSSARSEKLWDAGRWAEVIDHFSQDNEFDFVLTSGPAAHEQTHIAAITHRTRQKF